MEAESVGFLTTRTPSSGCDRSHAVHGPRTGPKNGLPTVHSVTQEPAPRLPPTEAAVLRVLVDNPGRVLGRETIMRLAGLGHLGTRRCDSAIVTLRRLLGPGSIRTVRRRGWSLTDEGRAKCPDLPESTPPAGPQV